MYRTFNSFQLSALSFQLRRGKYGFSLIELLIVLALVSLLLVGIWAVYNSGVKIFAFQEARSSIKAQSGRLFYNIAPELRQAVSLSSAQENSLSFAWDTDANGVEETIQYVWSGTQGEPLNRVLTSTVPSLTTTHPAVSSVNSLSLSYYDANNNLLSFPVTASEVRAVAIDLQAKDNEEIFPLRAMVRLRNL